MRNPDVVFVGTNDVAAVFVDEQTSSGSATISGVCEGTDWMHLEALVHPRHVHRCLLVIST